MKARKPSFFEKLTNSIHIEDGDETPVADAETPRWPEENSDDAQLTLDMYQTPTEIVVQSMVAGVRPEDLDINVTREMVTVKGTREKHHTIRDDDFFCRELYWGSFTRTVMLPQEVEADKAEATVKNGLLTIRIPKINKEKSANVKVKLG